MPMIESCTSTRSAANTSAQMPNSQGSRLRRLRLHAIEALGDELATLLVGQPGQGAQVEAQAKHPQQQQPDQDDAPSALRER